MDYIAGDFTLLPNRSVLQGQKAYVQSVYIWICSHTDARGQCWPSIKTIADEAGCSERSVKRAINVLEELGILVKKSGAEEGKSNTYQIKIVNIEGVGQTDMGVGQNDLGGVSDRPTNYNQGTTTKNNNQALSIDNGETHGKSEINEMFDFWKETTNIPITSYVQKNRFACNNLLKKHGVEGLQRLIRGVAMTHDDTYAPRIYDFVSLQARTNELLLWGKKKGVRRETASF